MRVLLVTNGLGYGGAERIVEAIALRLDAEHDVHVVATTRGGPIRDNLRAHGVHVSVLSIRSRFDIAVPLKIARVARRFRPDVVHSHLAVADIATALARPLLGAPIVSTVHNPGVELDRFKRTLWHRALRAFDRVTAVSEAVRAPLLATGLDPIVQPPSLVDPDAPLPSRAEARRALDLPPDAFVALGVGRLAPIKGFDVLAAARPHLEKEAILAVIGEGPERSKLAGLRLFGAREDARRLLVAADVVVCPSRSEGFPQVPLQAMAARLPVIGSRVQGMPEVVVDGVTGLLVPPDEPVALARAIDAIARDPALGRRLGEAGRARLVAEGLTLDAMIDRTIANYRSVARR